MVELDFEPFSVEAFPGLEFYLSGDREKVTLNSIETANDRQLPLLSVVRQGFLIRHAIPGDYAPIPPRDAGRIPLEGQEGLPRARPEAGAEGAYRPPRLQAAPAPRPEPDPLARFHGNPIRVRNVEGDVKLQVWSGYKWLTLMRLNADSGRVEREPHPARLIQTIRGLGFCMAHDGGIAVLAQGRNKGRVAPEEEPLEPIPQVAPDANAPLTERIMVLSQQFANFARTINRAQDLFVHARNHLDRNTPDWLQRVAENLAQSAVQVERNPHVANWIRVKYRWRQRENSWQFIGVEGAYNEAQAIGMPPPTMTRLPAGAEAAEGRYWNVYNRVPQDAWQRTVWFNCESRLFAPNAEHPPEHGGNPADHPGGDYRIVREADGGEGDGVALGGNVNPAQFPRGMISHERGGAFSPPADQDNLVARWNLPRIAWARDRNYHGITICSYRRVEYQRRAVWFHYDETQRIHRDKIGGTLHFTDAGTPNVLMADQYGIGTIVRLGDAPGVATPFTLTAALYECIARDIGLPQAQPLIVGERVVWNEAVGANAVDWGQDGPIANVAADPVPNEEDPALLAELEDIDMRDDDGDDDNGR